MPRIAWRAAGLVGAAAASLGAVHGRPPPPRMQARIDPASGQPQITEAGRPVLRFNHRTVEPGPILDQVSQANRIYAKPRSGYIHPLFGLDGEVLTRDWPVDHPHHRGIYWAWPEVEFRGERGDLHALQRVFSRPSGAPRLLSGAESAAIVAESRWMWEDLEPIVHERAAIRAHLADSTGRTVDLVLRFEALANGVTLARRNTDLYGGLNIRLAPFQQQQVRFYTDPPEARPRMAWGELCGFLEPGGPCGLAVLQHPANPDYPGDWVKYTELNWLQPTFPAARTRFALRPGQPLVLRYRLWVHRGGPAASAELARQWRACAAGSMPGKAGNP